MNFGEKLTKLRKQKGLSQEELGYELNVTRQTISKWELGQTTPEMDKLVEMSKVFGVTVDELTSERENVNNETQKIEDRPISDRPKNNSTLKVILLIVAIFIIGGILVYTFIFSKVLSFGKDVFDESRKMQEQLIEGMGNIVDSDVQKQESDKIKDRVQNLMEEQISDNEELKEQAEEIMQEVNEQKENSKEEMEAKQQELIEQAEQKQQELIEQYQQQKQQLLQQYQ